MKKTNKCENCSVIYDPFLRECPMCGRENNNHPLKGKHNNMLFTDSTKEILFFLVGLISIILFSFLFSTGFSKWKMDDNLKKTLITFLSYIFSLGIMFCVLSYDNKKYWKYYSNNKFIIFGLILLSFMLFLSCVASGIIDAAGITRGVNENEAQIRTLVKSYPALMFFVTVIFAPLIEEMAYRLGLFTFLYKYNKYLAYALTCIIFAFMHINFNAKDIATEFINLPFYLILGFLLTFGYEKEGIATSTFAHSLNNLFSFVFVLTMV